MVREAILQTEKFIRSDRSNEVQRQALRTCPGLVSTDIASPWFNSEDHATVLRIFFLRSCVGGHKRSEIFAGPLAKRLEELSQANQNQLLLIGYDAPLERLQALDPKQCALAHRLCVVRLSRTEKADERYYSIFDVEFVQKLKVDWNTADVDVLFNQIEALRTRFTWLDHVIAEINRQYQGEDEDQADPTNTGSAERESAPEVDAAVLTPQVRQTSGFSLANLVARARRVLGFDSTATTNGGSIQEENAAQPGLEGDASAVQQAL